MKADEGNDYLDTFIRQAVGKEPYYSFSRTGDSPVQWIQLLHALDQQDHPGWPLLKIQMQKCEKCARDFCSPINYRRHIRVHRRSLKVDKDSHKIRELLGTYWDKLNIDETKEVLSFKDVNLEEVPVSTVVRAITSNLRKPGFLTLPQAYVKAGSALVDVIQSRPSRLPISSQELFSILDDASERTFLCAGAAESMQKYVFDGEVAKIGLEMKNLVACVSFLVEQKLVKSWLADKDAEAWRLQKLLVEEEEAAQKRQADLLERKRQKKLRQKEQRAKDQSNAAPDILESPLSTETSSPPASSEADSSTLSVMDIHTPLEHQFANNEEEFDIEARGGCRSEHSDTASHQNFEPPKVQENGFQSLVISRRQNPKSQKVLRNGFHAGHVLHISKRETMLKHGTHRDPRVHPVNSSKVWTKKPKSESGGDAVRISAEKDVFSQVSQVSCQLMIGSISVTVKNCTVQQEVNHRADVQDNSGNEPKKSNVQRRHSQSTAKLWRLRLDSRGQLLDRSGTRVSKEDPTSENNSDQVPPSESCVGPSEMNENENENEVMNDSYPDKEDSSLPKDQIFSVDAVKAFLAQRWKEAISGEHLKLVLSSDSESTNHGPKKFQPPDTQRRSILVSTENQLLNGESCEQHPNTGNSRTKFVKKPKKGVKIKYIPKQKAFS